MKYSDTPPQVVISAINKVVQELNASGISHNLSLRWEEAIGQEPDDVQEPSLASDGKTEKP